MSVVSSLNTPSTYNDNDLYKSSGSLSAIPLSNERPVPRSFPFPVFQHSQTSPYPQSFSALGPPDDSRATSPLSQASPPAAPRPGTMLLPLVENAAVQEVLPPTPDPSPPNSKMLFPTMVKLAPPADDGPDKENISDAPRRLPMISIDTQPISPPFSPSDIPGPSQAKAYSGRTQGGSRAKSADQRMRRSTTTANIPTSARMVESRSADARARLRSGAGLINRHHTSTGYTRAQTPSPGLGRATSDSTPPRSQIVSTPLDLRPPDLGDTPDGLEAKVVLLGSQGAGKTSLILRYTSRIFSPSPAPATIGTSLYTRKLVHNGVRVKLQIWDTAGQERFRSMAPIYYRGAHVCVLVYDIADRQSFEDVRSWLEELGKTVPKETMIFVVGAKTDLASKRVVSAIRNWLMPPPPPPPPPPPQVLLSPARNLFRNPSISSRDRSLLPTPTPTRSHSHSGLAAIESAPKIAIPFPSGPSSKPTSILNRSSPSVPFPSRRITLPSSPTQISFPTLQSPSSPTFATNTETVQPNMIPASAMRGHKTSAGRFSFSGVLGYGKPEASEGAASSLARMAEENDAAVARSPKTSFANPGMTKSKTAGNLSSYIASSSTRTRTESSPLFSDESAIRDSRRKSEDWSSKSWRMGEGPGAAETLGEFGEGVKRRGSGELLVRPTFGRTPSSAGVSGMGGSGVPVAGRNRGGSLGRDERLYPKVGGEEPVEEGDGLWGIQVESIRLGECSALTGEGVESLFKSISSLLVDRKDKIERERVLRHKHSVMLTDPSMTPADSKSASKWGGGCC